MPLDDKKRIGRTPTKLFCPVCNDMATAKQETLEETLTLSCGHIRELELPSRPGAVGLEEIQNKNDPNSTIAMQLFTLKTDNGLDGIAEARRQSWQ